MCPLIGRRYYDWMLKVNNRFTEVVQEDTDFVLEQLRSNATLGELAVGLGVVEDPDHELAMYLETVPVEFQQSLKDEVAAVVEARGPVYFDWQKTEDADEWGVIARKLPGDPEGVVVLLSGPFDRETSSS